MIKKLNLKCSSNRDNNEKIVYVTETMKFNKCMNLSALPDNSHNDADEIWWKKEKIRDEIKEKKNEFWKLLKQRIFRETNKQYSENSYGNNNVESICNEAVQIVASRRIMSFILWNPPKSSHWSEPTLEAGTWQNVYR